MAALLPYFSSLWVVFSWKISLLLLCEMLGLFFNTLTVDGKYSLRNIESLLQPVQMQISKKQNTFSNFFPSFLNITFNFKYSFKT